MKKIGVGPPKRKHWSNNLVYCSILGFVQGKKEKKRKVHKLKTDKDINPLTWLLYFCKELLE